MTVEDGVQRAAPVMPVAATSLALFFRAGLDGGKLRSFEGNEPLDE